MSYCRLTDSDAYIYDSDCGVQFYVAGEFGRDLDRLCRTYNEAYQYAKTLRDEHGLDVPDYAIEALRSDALEEVEGACGPNGVVAELRAENTKLRELARKLYGGYMGGHYMISCNGCEHAYEDCGGHVPLDPDYCVFSFSDRYVGCWRQKRLEAEMRELGVEVDG